MPRVLGMLRVLGMSGVLGMPRVLGMSSQIRPRYRHRDWRCGGGLLANRLATDTPVLDGGHAREADSNACLLCTAALGDHEDWKGPCSRRAVRAACDRDRRRSSLGRGAKRVRLAWERASSLADAVSSWALLVGG